MRCDLFCFQAGSLRDRQCSGRFIKTSCNLPPNNVHRLIESIRRLQIGSAPWHRRACHLSWHFLGVVKTFDFETPSWRVVLCLTDIICHSLLTATRGISCFQSPAKTRGRGSSATSHPRHGYLGSLRTQSVRPDWDVQLVMGQQASKTF